ncbi:MULTISPECIES: hypothetical protein [Inquilinus]|uniref:Uncharacterized protein n=1 Tax=Inquilinus ginsengisoli TaxID=363840 RepID=A0ABU1JIE8_9PROT|nr:hypothetical protein [Inquilinus ginsengisoli]MDR6288356.1 hypothetical protein [Inquilinus ginsengisoli]
MPWIGATLLGALVPAAIVSVVLAWQESAALLLPALSFAFIITLGHTLILGLPVALFYRAKRWHRPELAVATGFLIGVVPVGVLGWRIPVWPGYLLILVLFGGLGASGALAFWLTLRRAGVLDGAPASSE